jgi:hypothetical protein
MDPRKLFIDERLKSSGFCVYCGAAADSRDHVPSKVLLDEPFPENLAVVEACSACNGGFSQDEAYFACFLECVLVGLTEPDLISRAKINRILDEFDLRGRIQSSCQTDGKGGLIWLPEFERVQNIAIKLARGHVAYELSSAPLGPPSAISILPLISMSDASRRSFEGAGADFSELGLGPLRPWPSSAAVHFCVRAGLYRICRPTRSLGNGAAKSL